MTRYPSRPRPRRPAHVVACDRANALHTAFALCDQQSQPARWRRLKHLLAKARVHSHRLLVRNAFQGKGDPCRR